MLGKIEHLGIAVKDLDKANETYEKLLGRKPYKSEAVESEHVITSFFKAGENKIELLAATHEDSAIAKYIEKKGEGIHHVAFNVEDINAELKRLEKEGFTILNKEPKKGAHIKWVAFIHPKSSNGVLVELCQEIAE
ncbi:methylmalonyl-CoA epimerase [Nonlabens mediterrranea]|uniref:Methylmalonyl-CoA epimerase n=1 Tax=Nonlabens mediterrranea TaxID=1419947 RepID=A0ABS0A6I7_9FLAO|nr:methylmalonyl-CoA epimerase [Nonlabens mediterrranea]